MRNVIVLNQFAIPRSETGGARHVNLFGRLDNWEPLYVASNRRHYSQERYRTDDRHFRLVWVPRHRRQLSRILGWGVYAAQAFAITVTRRRVDVVYGSSPNLLAPLAGLVAARVRRARFVLEVRDLWPESIVAAGIIRSGSALERALGRLERLLATAADAIVVVTPGWEEHFSALGVAPSRLTVISNGADPEDFRVYEARDALRSELGVDGFTAVFAGSHGPKDGIDLILEAAAQVPEISFLLIGDGTAKRASQDEAARRGLTNVDFRSPVPKSELGRVLAACDVGIHSVAPLTVFSHGMSPNKLLTTWPPASRSSATPGRRFAKSPWTESAVGSGMQTHWPRHCASFTRSHRNNGPNGVSEGARP